MKGNAENVDRMIVDNVCVGPSSATSAEPHCGPVVFGPVRPPMYSKGTSRCQEVSRLQVEVPGSRLVSGPKHKDDLLTKYQSDFGDENPIVTNFQGKSPIIDLQPPSQCQLMKSCRMKSHKKNKVVV